MGRGGRDGRRTGNKQRVALSSFWNKAIAVQLGREEDQSDDCTPQQGVQGHIVCAFVGVSPFDSRFGHCLYL